MELKTLKDLEQQDWSTIEGNNKLVGAVFFDIRQELGIKRIKELDKRIRNIENLKELSCSIE